MYTCKFWPFSKTIQWFSYKKFANWLLMQDNWKLLSGLRGCLTNLRLRLHESTGKYNKIDSWIQTKNGCFPSPKTTPKKSKQPYEPNHQPTHQSPNTEVFFVWERCLWSLDLWSLLSLLGLLILPSFPLSLFASLLLLPPLLSFGGTLPWGASGFGTRSMERWMQQLSCLSHL